MPPKTQGKTDLKPLQGPGAPTPGSPKQRPPTSPESSNRPGGAPQTCAPAERAEVPFPPRPSPLARSVGPTLRSLSPRRVQCPEAQGGSASPSSVSSPHRPATTHLACDRRGSLPAPPGTEGGRRWLAARPPPVSSFPASSHPAPTGAPETLTSPPQPRGRSPLPDTRGDPNTRGDGPEARARGNWQPPKRSSGMEPRHSKAGTPFPHNSGGPSFQRETPEPRSMGAGRGPLEPMRCRGTG